MISFSGKVKVNEATIVSSNIPATNGVVHAIDTLLWTWKAEEKKLCDKHKFQAVKKGIADRSRLQFNR